MGARPTRATWVALAAGIAVALVVGLGVRQLHARRAAMTRPPPKESPLAAAFLLHVPHIPGSITLDGDTDDPGWTTPPGPARTGPFRREDGREAIPYSSVRMLWGDGHLYLSLYASDEDIESRTDEPDGPLWLDDSFRVVFSRGGVDESIEVSPKGVITDAIRKGGGAYDYSWSSGVHASPERDGTVNKPDDMDEEWAIEMAVPFESLGMKGEPGETVDVTIKRCDTPKKSARVCAQWDGRLVLD
jgi:hypothetical protein